MISFSEVEIPHTPRKHSSRNSHNFLRGPIHASKETAETRSTRVTREVQVFETLPGGCSRWQMSYPSHSSNLRNMKHWSLVSARRVSRGGIATAHTLRWLGGLCVDGKLVNSVKLMCQFSSELLQVAFLNKHLKYLQDWNSTVFAFFAKLFGGNLWRVDLKPP